MEWLRANWFWLAVILFWAGMHLVYGRGGRRGHEAHRRSGKGGGGCH